MRLRLGHRLLAMTLLLAPAVPAPAAAHPTYSVDYLVRVSRRDPGRAHVRWLLAGIDEIRSLRLVFRDDGGTAFDLGGAPVLAVGDLALRNQITLAEAASWGVAARLDLKVPVGSLASAGGSGGFDAGAGLLATLEPTDWLTLHGLVALSAFSELACTCSLQPKTWHFTGEISAAASWGKTTFLIEDRALSPLFPGGWNRNPPTNGDDGLLSSGFFADFRVHNQVTFAVRRGRFTVWLSEDFTPGPNPRSTLSWAWSSNAPDILLGLSFTQPL